MRPLVFTWPHAVVFWLVLWWAFAPEFRIIQRARSAAAEPSSADAGSMRVIAIGQGIGFFAAFLLSWVRAFRVPPAANFAAFCTGIALLIAGSVLRRHCFRVLGEFFTGDVRARADQPVIDRGAYRFVRHPSYSAGILMLTGVGVATGSWLSALILIASSVTVYWYRVSVEERALLQTIGEPYAAFMKTRKRFVPFIL